MLEFVFGWARIIFLETNNMRWCRCCFTFFFKVFWHRDSIIFCNSPAVVLGESLATQTLPSHHALGRYRNIFLNILCWLEILNYYPDGGNWNFHSSTAFLKATSQIFEAQLSFAAHQKSIFFFIVMDYLGFVFHPIYISVKQEGMAG